MWFLPVSASLSTFLTPFDQDRFMKKYSLPFFAVCVLALVPGFAQAQTGQPRLLATYGDWDSYIIVDGDNRICYMASKSMESKGDYTKRGDSYAMVTHRPSDGVRNEFSFIAGYNYKSGSDVSVEIDDQKFVLFTKDDSAWTSDAETDSKLAKAIAAGSKMVVRGVSSRGTATIDTISLKGTGEARKRIDQECR
jgi:invasion protein IalB